MEEKEQRPRSSDELLEAVKHFDGEIKAIASEGLKPDGSRNPGAPVMSIMEDAFPYMTARRALLFALGKIPLEEVCPLQPIETTADELELGLPVFPGKEGQSG